MTEARRESAERHSRFQRPRELLLKKLFATILIAVLGILILLAGCRRGRMNVVVIVIDTLRQDHLALYGYERENAPFLSRLGERGVVLDGLSTTSWTKPATASLLTGLHPLRHQTFGRTDSLPDEVATLAEILKAHGYQTSGISANGHISSEFGFEQGFDQLRLVAGLPPDDHASSDTVNRILLPAVSKLVAPFFLYVHYIDPHYPYAPDRAWNGEPLDSRLASRRDLTFRDFRPSLVLERDPQLVRDAIDLYDGEIRKVDGAIEALFRQLDQLGNLENTLFIITSDHGEEFQDHGMMSHGQTLYEEVTRVPLIFYSPRVAKPGAREGTAILEDVVPTILDVLGIEATSAEGRPVPFDGVSLAAVLAGRSMSLAERSILLHLDYIEPTPVNEGIGRTALGYIDGGRKLLLTKFPFRKEIFDLSADPGEQRNIAPSVADASRLTEGMMELYRGLARSPIRRRIAEIDEAMKESLRALGYLSGRSSGEVRTIPRRIDTVDLSADRGFGWEVLGSEPCISPSSVSAESHLLSGWHYPDANGRWTMRQAHFQMANREGLRTRLLIEGANWSSETVTMTASSEGVVLGSASIAPGKLEFSVEVPPWEGNRRHFELSLDRTFSPADRGDADVRNLGVFVRRLCLEPAPAS